MSQENVFKLKLDNDGFLNRSEQTFNIFASGTSVNISKDGFIVNGKKVKQDENEAKEVYEAFKKLIGYSK